MTNIDTIWRAKDQNVLSGGASNLGSVSQTFGGVGYNLALAAGRVSGQNPPIFLTAVGADHFGDQIRASTRAVRLNCVRVSSAGTGQYTCVVKPDGELAMAIQDMAISSKFTPERLPKAVLRRAGALLVDFNLPPVTLDYVAGFAGPNTPLFVEPTSLFKISGRTSVLRHAEAAFPNLVELLTFHACLVGGAAEPDYSTLADRATEILESKEWLETISSICGEVFSTGQGPNYFLVTLADRGLLYCPAEGDLEHYSLEESVNWSQVDTDSEPCHVNGCGDTLAGVYVASIIGDNGLDRSTAIKRALTAAQIALRHTRNVPDELPN